MMTKRALPLAAALTLALGACSGPADDGPRVLASIYPLQFLVQELAGDRLTVTSLTPQGAEPHDLELAPAQVRTLGGADLLVYVSALQPAVDEAVATSPAARVVDAVQVLGLAHEHDTHEHEEDHDEAAHEGEDPEGHEHEGHDHEGHDHDGDPHFWLDPTLLAALAHPVAEALAEVDPAGATTFAANAERLAAELTELDEEYARTLARCERDVVVVSHEAYGYLTERYDLVQVGLSGLDPEGEPSPARLREIRRTIAQHDVTTVFTEHLVSPKAAEVLASDLGLTTAVLDPVEAQTDPQADYRDVMRSNLQALSTALGCA